MESFLAPMLCGKADVPPEGDAWIAEPKFDGWRAVAHIHGSVNLYCGRNGSEYSGKLPYIDAELSRFLPADSAVDGELLGGEWGDVQGVMTRGDGPHVPSAAVPALTYIIFDITRFGGSDLRKEPWSKRREFLEAAFKAREGDVEHLKLSPVGVSNMAALDGMLLLDMEGIVCKRTDSPYVNKRANYWIKVKPQDTEDGEIVGFYDATPGSKYEGWAVGGLCFRLASGFEGRAAGMDDPLRKEMYDHPERFIGRTIELKHHGIGKEGALRHPNFFRFRDDVDGVPSKTAEKLGTPKTAPRVASKPSKRNYGAMGDPKLQKVLKQLRERNAEAVAKAGGEEYVERDIEVVEALIEERGL